MSDKPDNSYLFDIDSTDDEIIDWIEKNIGDIIDVDDVIEHKPRKHLCKRNYWSTKWGDMLQHPSVSDPSSVQGKEFRLRFRVPYPIYYEIILPRCREVNLFGVIDQNKVRIPLEFKILIALRILGKDSVRMVLHVLIT